MSPTPFEDKVAKFIMLCLCALGGTAVVATGLLVMTLAQWAGCK